MLAPMSRFAGLALLLLGHAQDPADAPLRGLRAALYRADLAQAWFLCADGAEARVRAFDAFLREVPAEGAWPGGGTEAGADGALRLQVWGGRTLTAGADGGLHLAAQPWELPPRLEWGPGWATVEVRTAAALAPALWRRAGTAEVHAAPFTADRFDGIRQRARLRGLTPGETLEIALPPLLPAFPAPAAPVWERFTVPAVDPAGARPTAAWPSR